jgi:MFS family permease
MIKRGGQPGDERATRAPHAGPEDPDQATTASPTVGPNKERDRLGPDFAKLWLAQAVSNVGDGVYLTALPLLAATLTRDPLPVSAVVFAEWLPWLLFGLVAGALLDRWNRRRVMWVVDAGRFAVVGAFAVAVLAGWASIPLLMVTGFLLGTGQTLVDTASQALIPTLVSRDRRRLERANGRLQGTQVVTQQLAGPPAGGLLFSAGAWLPFGVDAVSFAASSALVASIPAQHAASGARGTEAPATADHRASLFAEIAEGLRWLVHHRVLRTMALLAAGVNLLSVAHTAILVLFAQERLGLGSVGFGLLLTAGAVGGLVGSVIAPWLSRHAGPAQVMVGGFVAGGLAKVGIGLTYSPWIAGGLLAATGMFPIIYNVVFGSLRQRLIPDRLLGRVNSAYSLCTYGAVPLGALLGGVLAHRFGLSAPFLVAGILIPAMGLLALRSVNRRTIDQALAEQAQDAAPSRPGGS